MTDLELTDRSGGAVVGSTAEKPGIFISYARSDSAALAEELVAGLELAGFRPFLDRHDIAGEARLGALILGADTIVFILSPAAVRSERCAWEVERAAELGKRLIPVQAAPVPEADVPERLRRLNYIFFREGRSVARPLRELAAALRRDVEWIREHTRLSEAAARWRARDRGTGAANDLLLRGDELADARAWLARRKENAPEITALLTSFLTASEDRAAVLANQERERLAERERLVEERERAQHNVRRVQQRWSAILAGLAVVVVLGTGVGLWSVFNGWRDLMATQAQFIAGIVDQQTANGDPVDAMLIGLDALPDETSEGIRQRVLGLEMSAVNALDGAWRNWSSDWGERAFLAGHTDIITAVAFSPHGTRVLTGSWDKTARLWDAATGKPVATLTGHTDPVAAVAFSPDGTRVLTGSDDHTARLWDAATGKAVATLAANTDGVTAVEFSPDGRRVLTGSADNTARLWDATTGKVVASSRPKEFHLRALPEPCMTLSSHTAPDVRPLP